MNRRRFFQLLLASGVASLGGVAAFQFYQQQSKPQGRSLSLQFLSTDEQNLLLALAPIVMGKSIYQIDPLKILGNIDESAIRLPMRTQTELRELFSTLSSLLGRLVLAGVWLNWHNSDPAAIEKFLSSWREHSLSLLQQAYLGLRQIIMGAAYAESDLWHNISYPGPPQLMHR